MPGNQFDIQGGGDQLVIMPSLGIRHFPQPVTRRTAGAYAHHNQAGQATEDLSTGKGHGLHYLIDRLRTEARKKANTIHPQL